MNHYNCIVYFCKLIIELLSTVFSTSIKQHIGFASRKLTKLRINQGSFPLISW